FSPAGGHVSVTARREGARYVVAVKDAGIGIPTDLQPRLFERFFRADRARTHQNDPSIGAGLGLAISRWIAEAHDGELTLLSSDENGSVFVASLPFASSNGTEPESAPRQLSRDVIR
ncbi:MAG TPA: ATP-binding protein, partial [Candidatus Acidoferrales bacterium]